ncbi:hypothetical protein PM082_004878 [Marasmius tenuissimus]|nr:hypothetical protein PM082_004878 [Marasmius tenuissimus]
MGSSGPFMPNSQQSGLPSGPNSTHPPPMGMIGGNPQNPNGRFLPQSNGMIPGGQQPRQMTLARPNGPPMNPNGGPPMNNMNMGLNFPSSTMMPGPGGQANQIRRVTSQSSIPSGMTPGTLSMGMGQGIGNSSMGMGLNPGMPPNMRQVGQPMPGQPPQMPMRGHMQPEGSMSINRPNPGMSNQNIVRSTPTPLMEFTTSSSSPSSPRPGPTANIGMPGPGSLQNPMNRRTPEDNMLFGGNANFPQGPQNNRMPNGTYPLIPSTPPNQIDMPGSLNNTPNSAANHSNFMTPAQKLGEMHPTENFSPFGLNQGQNGVPSHPPQPHNPSHPGHPPRPPSTHHQSPHPDMGMNIYPARPQSQPQNNHVGRPPSSQAPRPSSLQPPSQHPTPMQQHQQPPAAPPNSAGLPHPGRMPPQNPGGSVGPTSQSLLQTGLRPSSSGGPGQLIPAGSSSTTHVGPSSQPQPLAIAPRPSQLHNPQQAPQQQQQRQPSHPPGAPPADTSPRDESSPPSATTAGPSQPPMPPGSGNGMHGPLPSYQMHMTRPGGQLPNPTAGPSSVPQISSVGHGQGLMRLLQFSGCLATENKTQKLQLAWWNELVREYFTPKAMMKYTLWKDNQRTEAKVFVTTQSGVKSMTLTLDGARERLFDYGHAIVECVSAVWTYKYNNGYTVLLKGPMTVHVVITTAQPAASGHHPHHQLGGNYHLKFENFEFEAKSHEKFIALDSIGGTRSNESPKLARLGSGRHLMNGMSVPGPMDSVMDQDDEERRWEEPRTVIERGTLPGEPVNAFGIPQATMRCLELSDSCADMADLIAYSAEYELGPMDALKALGTKLREAMPHFQPGQMINGFPNMGQGMGTPTAASFPHNSGTATMSTGSPSTLYSPAPTTLTNSNANSITPTMAPASAKNSPQHAPGSTQNSPRKQHKTIPPPSGPPGIAPAIGSSTSVSSSTPGASSGNTPSLTSATLKRKQNPDTDNQPPLKRTQRRQQPRKVA